MSNNLKIPSPWSQFALFLVLSGGALILALVVVSLLPGVHPGVIPGDPDTLKLMQTVSSIILFGLPALVFARQTFYDHPLANLGFRPAVKNRFYLLAVLLLFCSFPLEGWLGMINQRAHLPSWMVKSETEINKQIMVILEVHKPIDLYINLVVVAVLPGIFEELCFRGVLQRILINMFKNPWAGIVVTAFAFSFIHMEFSGFLPRMFLGILLGASYWYSGSLWTNILAHCCFNGVQVLAATWYPKTVTENPSIPFYWALISLVLVVGLLAYMRKRSTITYAQVYPAGRADGFPG